MLVVGHREQHSIDVLAIQQFLIVSGRRHAAV